MKNSVKKKKKTRKISTRKFVLELLQWIIIISLIFLIFYRTRSVNVNNAEIITGTISNIYYETAGTRIPWRVFFTVSNRKCYYTANTLYKTKDDVKDLVNLLREAERNRNTVTVWIIDHAEFAVNRLAVGECETVAAIETTTVHIPVEYYNQRNTIGRIILSIVPLLLCIFKLLYIKLAVLK